MHKNCERNTEVAWGRREKAKEAVQQQTMLPSISHIIDGRSLGLLATEWHHDNHASSEDEIPVEEVDFKKTPCSQKATGSNRRHSRGRIADRAPKLEEQLKQQDAKYDKENIVAYEKFRQLQMSLESEKSKCSLLEEMLDKERADRIKVEKEIEHLKPTSDWKQSRTGSEAST